MMEQSLYIPLHTRLQIIFNTLETVTFCAKLSFTYNVEEGHEQLRFCELTYMTIPIYELLYGRLTCIKIHTTAWQNTMHMKC